MDDISEFMAYISSFPKVLDCSDSISKFIDYLSSTTDDLDNAENIYASSFEYNEIARNNLTLYLKRMCELKPKFLLVGEAPGHKDCRWSGIPFTSEKILVENSFFGKEKGYKVRDFASPESEATSTIVWECLKKVKTVPLMWNAFPFHPYSNDNAESNRTPSKKELVIGKEILLKLIEIYGIEEGNIIPVGNKAGEILKDFNTRFRLTHPSHGGKESFVNGMKEIITTNAYREGECFIIPTKEQEKELYPEGVADFPWEESLMPLFNYRFYHAVAYCNDLSIKEGLKPYYYYNGKPLSIFSNWSSSVEDYAIDEKANGYRLPYIEELKKHPPYYPCWAWDTQPIYSSRYVFNKGTITCKEPDDHNENLAFYMVRNKGGYNIIIAECGDSKIMLFFVVSK